MAVEVGADQVVKKSHAAATPPTAAVTTNFSFYKRLLAGESTARKGTKSRTRSPVALGSSKGISSSRTTPLRESVFHSAALGQTEQHEIKLQLAWSIHLWRNQFRQARKHLLCQAFP